LLVSWCVGDMCNITYNDEDHDRSKRPSAEDQEWSSTGQVFSGRTIERSGDVVYSLHPQKIRR
jgi:hypothetical protein